MKRFDINNPAFLQSACAKGSAGVDYMWLQAIEDGCKAGFYVNSTASVQPTLYYSFDKQNWSELTDQVSVAKNKKIYFKGENEDGLLSYSDISANKINQFNCIGKFNAGGNIQTLIDGETPGTTARGVFCLFFRAAQMGCDIVEANKLLLPATTLSNYCYANMFNACTSLTSAPELPATTLAIGCYMYMFGSCTSLTTAPELPATTLADMSYFYLFTGSAVKEVKIHATTWNSNYALSWLTTDSGTLYKPSALQIGTGTGQIPENSENGIPSGWTWENFD